MMKIWRMMRMNKHWSTATAEYGSPEHQGFMRDGFEPFGVIPLQTNSTGVIGGTPSISFLVFFKKEIKSDGIIKN